MPEKQLKKLDPRAKPYILVGYGSNQYKLLDPSTKKTIWCRDVYILEGKFRDPLDTPYPEDDQLVIEDWDEELEIKDITEAIKPKIEAIKLDKPPIEALLIKI